MLSIISFFAICIGGAPFVVSCVLGFKIINHFFPRQGFWYFLLLIPTILVLILLLNWLTSIVLPVENICAIN